MDDEIKFRQELVDLYGEDDVFNREELTLAFEVHSFWAPFITVTRKRDNVRGCLQFSDMPRFYFNFTKYNLQEEG